MSDSKEQQVRERAYALWEKEGAPHGRDAEFWERASRMVQADDEVPPRPARRQSATDEALEESFPASDPPASTGATAGAAATRKRKR